MLKIKNLRKSFTGADKVTTDVIDIPEFDLEKNVQIAVTGESGLGKSTFLNLISGIVNPDSGEIIINGTDITKLSEAKKDLFRARNTGYIFQTFNLLQGFSALENVLLGMMFSGKPDRKKSEEALSRTGLSGKLNNRPSELSVGEQQRVAVARAIVNSPGLLLADEPTANLDSKNSVNVIELIKNLCRESNISLILVSHEKSVVSEFSNTIDFSELNKCKQIKL